ncbi:MAG: nucleotidyltransferase family protein [Candidatus Rokubacteria bacterium]|nr:nucleotidyltransferase family protein [Candidatus Rokubacteria bacterium]
MTALAVADVPLAVLAGGLATRLGAEAAGRPKALVDVAGEPFIAHQLALARRRGVTRVVLCVAHLAEQIEAYVGDGRRFGLAVEYSHDGVRPLGTAGAVRLASARLGPVFWVMYGDTYLDVDLRPIVDALARARALGLMTVYRNENRFDRSNVVFRDGRLLAYDKRVARPDMTHIDYGVALLRREALADVPPDEPRDLADVYAALVARGAMEGFEVHERFYEIGSPDGLAETRRVFAARRRTTAGSA